MLADVAQVFDERHLAEPVQVIDHDGGVRPLEIQIATELLAHALGVLPHLLAREQHALLILAAGVTDHAGAAADDQDGAMASALKVRQDDHRHEVADLQARLGRIEPAIDVELTCGRRFRQVALGDLTDEATCLELGKRVGKLRVRDVRHCSCSFAGLDGTKHGGVPTPLCRARRSRRKGQC